MLKINSNYKKGIGWGLAAFAGLGLFSYLTFVPEQTFAAEETRTLADINYMQEMNKYVCENTTDIDTQYQLTDVRDGKKYWVAKHLDGNCWMAQNLDFDVPDSLTPETSDVTKIVDMTNNGVNSGVASITEWVGSDGANTNNYYDPGDYIYSYNNHVQAPNGVCQDVISITAPSCVGYFTQAKADSDLHYHVGNFYTAASSTAKSGNGMMTGDAPMSICPKGWKLPTSDNTSSGSFAYLLTQYGVQSKLASGTYAIYKAPLYFVYSGQIIITNGVTTTYRGGREGDYWSSTAYTMGDNGTYTYFLSFGNTVGPNSFATNRSDGLSIRCVSNSSVLTSDNLSGPDVPPSDDQANVAITVSPVISIDVTQHVDTDVDFTRVARSSIIARVGSNQPYQVLFSTDKSALTNDSIEQNIPMITADQKIMAGTSNWGIKKLASAGDNVVNADTIYSPVGIGDNKALFYTSNTAAAEDLTFPVAIAVDANLPSGKYSTQVTLTAVAM